MPVVIFANIHPPAKSKSGNFITETFERNNFDFVAEVQKQNP